MANVEELLQKEKERFDNIAVPTHLEQRLTKALAKSRKPKRKTGLVAAALLVLLFFSYNYDAIAFYSKQILGYDEVIYGAIKELNEKGQGQAINKSYEFANGTVLTLDGIMLDENRLISFYTLKHEAGNIDDYHLRATKMNGLRNYYAQGGYGQSNEEFTEIRWVHDFEPPKFFERSLTFEFSLSGPNNFNESGTIKFKLDRTKAMGYSIKQRINKTIDVGNTTVNFKHITASPTQTVVEGSIGTPLEYLEGVRKNKYSRFIIDYDLIVNGQVVRKEGGGLSTSAKGITFEGRFEALPKQVEELAIKLVRLTISEPVEETLNIASPNKKLNYNIKGNDIVVERVYSKNGATYVTLNTEDHILLEKVYLLLDGQQVSLERTIPGDYEKHPDGRITYKRILEFKGTGENADLLVKRIKYAKSYNKRIEIPID